MRFNWKLFPGTNLQDLNLDWIINFVKMIPSRLPKFSDHHTWLVYDYSTGEYYDSGEPTGGAGEPGEPGKSPIIGSNGNWYTWNTETGTYTDTGTRAQGVQGEPGAGVASGGVAGDVLVKASGVDYNTGWTATPPQMGSLAHINAGNTADKIYNKGDYLVYNGQLYIVTDTTISQGVTLNPETGGNIEAVSLADDVSGIVSSGYTGGCRWCKFADGTMIEWTFVNFTNVAITTPWGALYETSTAQVLGNWGVPFVARPAVTIMNSNGTAANIESVLNMSETYIGNAYLWCPVSGTYSPAYNIIGIGRWKN